MADWAHQVLDVCQTGQVDVVVHRPRAKSLWPANGPDTEPEFPRYFEDRLAFRLALLQHTTPDGDLPPDILEGAPLFAGRREFDVLLRTHPLVGPAFPGDRPEQEYQPHPLTIELLERWHSLLVTVGLPVPESHFDPHQYRQWKDVFDDSIYRPGPPAIDGPSFLNRFTSSHQKLLLNKYGRDGIVAFTMTLAIAHERTHRLQRGEPLLSEFILASLWVKFIAEQNIDDLQNDPQTMASCTIEKPYLPALSPFHEKGVASDTALLLRDIRQGRTKWYSLMCAIAYLHDGGYLSYPSYLQSLTSILHQCADGAGTPDIAPVLSRLRPPRMLPKLSVFNPGGDSAHRN